MRRLMSFLVALAVVVGAVPIGGAAAQAADGPFALALGDSIAAGFQPSTGGDTHLGYADQLRDLMAERIPGLHLRNLACSGETTRGMIAGDGSPCTYAAGSQLDAAVAFLTAHPGDVAYVTIDIGMNDVLERCLDESFALAPSCFRQVLPGVQRRLTRIVDALHAAGGPDVPIAAMTYYDPFLGLWGLAPGGRRLAQLSLRSFLVANRRFDATYAATGLVTADVAATFAIEDFTPINVPGRGMLPRNVARACRWTWFCDLRSLGDPHPNELGHRRIAHTFSRVLRQVILV